MDFVLDADYFISGIDLTSFMDRGPGSQPVFRHKIAHLGTQTYSY